MTPTETASCGSCGGQIVRVDTPLPGGPLVPWWFHMSEAEAQWCPGTGRVLPDDPPEYEPPEDDDGSWVTDEVWAEAAAEYARDLTDR